MRFLATDRAARLKRQERLAQYHLAFAWIPRKVTNVPQSEDVWVWLEYYARRRAKLGAKHIWMRRVRELWPDAA